MVTVLANKKGNLMVSLRERFSRQAGKNRHKGRCHHPPATECLQTGSHFFDHEGNQL